MKISLEGILRTKTVYQSTVTASSTVISGVLGIIFYIYLARFLGPSFFGVFSVATTTSTLVSDIANIGTDTGIVRFVGKYRKKQRHKAFQFLKLGLKTKLIVGLAVLTIGWLIIPFVSDLVLDKPELVDPLRISLLGSFGLLLFSFTTSAIQAYEKFISWGILNISLNLLRLIAIFLLLSLGVLTIQNALLSYIIFPFLGFVVGSFLLPKYWSVKGENRVSSEFFRYNKWVALFVLLAAFSSRIDTYLTMGLLDLREVGIYSVATTLGVIGSQIVTGIATVVAPKLSSFQTNFQAVNYLKKLQIFVSGLGILALILGVPFLAVLIPLFYGGEYLESVVPSIILLVSGVIFLISVPAHTSVFYYFSYPKLFVGISLIHLMIIGGLGWILISNWGPVGAAFTVLVGNLSNLIIPSVWVINRFKLTSNK